MVGILIVSHHRLAEAAKETVSLIVGERENLSFLPIMKNDRPEDFAAKLKQKRAEADRGDGVLILADMFGGTPSNVSLALFANDDKVSVITGFNLPLVMEAVMHSGKPLAEMTELLMSRRDKTIIDAKAMMRKAGR